MKSVLAILLCVMAVGCSPTSKEARIKQVQQMIQRSGGEAEMRKESEILFSRCSAKKWALPGVGPEDRVFDGLRAIKRLGDVFYYEPGYLRVRVHHTFRGSYFIYIVDPTRPEPVNFERIVGNVGFLESGS